MAQATQGAELVVAPAPTPGRIDTVRQTLGVTFDILRRDRFALAGVIIYAVMIVVAVLAPLHRPLRSACGDAG